MAGILRLAAVLAAAAIVAATGGAARADTIGSVTSKVNALLGKFEPASDGTLSTTEALGPGNTIHVVDRDNKDSWKIDVGPGGAVTFENDTMCDPTATPLPSGALHLVLADGESYARLRSTRYHRTYLRDLTRLDYWTCDNANNGQQLPYIILDIDWNGDNTVDDLIFFEPAYQNPSEGGACGAGSGQAVQTNGVWQFWDALRNDAGTFRACYWALSSVLETGGPTIGCGEGEFVCPLSDYIAQHPDAAIINVDGNHGGVQIVHGFDGGSPYDGWVDAFTIGKDINGTNGQTYNSTITYDFQAP